MLALITGGAGFLGSHVADIFLQQGWDVVAVDNLRTGRRGNLSPDIRLIERDIRDNIDSVFELYRPEVVVHLAAQVSVPASVQDPGLDLSVNVDGTVRVMTNAARVGARKFITVSSAAVYGAPRSLPLTEESATVPLSPYGLSKLTAEHYVRLLGGLYAIPYTILRPANIFGPRQLSAGEGAVIPAFIERFLAAKDPVIHGDGSQTRDFIYVSDMARAIFAAVENGDGFTLNVSSGVPVTINAIWHLLAEYVGWRRAPVYGAERIGDILHSTMSNEAVRKYLEWEPTVGFEAGIINTLAWYSSRKVAASASSLSSQGGDN